MPLKFKQANKYRKIQTMRPAFKQEFAEELRSGKHLQGTGKLHRIDWQNRHRYCVLGVAVLVAKRVDPEINKDQRFNFGPGMAYHAGIRPVVYAQHFSTSYGAPAGFELIDTPVVNYQHVSEILNFSDKHRKIFFPMSGVFKVDGQLVRGLPLILLNDHGEPGFSFKQLADVVDQCF